MNETPRDRQYRVELAAQDAQRRSRVRDAEVERWKTRALRAEALIEQLEAMSFAGLSQMCREVLSQREEE